VSRPPLRLGPAAVTAARDDEVSCADTWVGYRWQSASRRARWSF